MIIFLHGPDTYRSRQHLHQIIEKFKRDRDPQGLNVVRLDALKESAGRIQEEMMSLPFLAERRMVVIENALTAKDSALSETLLNTITGNRLPASNVIVFWEGTSTFKTKAAKALFARLLEEKFAQAFDELKGIALERWIANEMSIRGGQTGVEVVKYLALHAGKDMWGASALVDQLIAYSRTESGVQREIVRTDAEMFLSEKVDDNIFALIDAIVSRQEKQVFAMIQEQYRQGEDVQFIFAMLVRQFRILLEMRDMFERDDTLQSQVFAQALGIHPFVAKKTLPLVRRYTMSELRSIYQELLDLDRTIKSGEGDPEMLLDVFVGRLCVA